MSVVTYTAKSRELSPGTTDLTTVTREFRLLSSRPSRVAVRKQNTALGGAVESILNRHERRYNCVSEHLEPDSIVDLQMIEFLTSVENGETFTFDRNGTVAQPDNPVTCIMVSSQFPSEEVAKTYHQYGFVIREA